MKKFSLGQQPKIMPGFVVPDGYFETLGDRIENRIGQKIPPKIHRLQINGNWLAAAAVLIIALSLPAINFMIPFRESDSEAEIVNYLASDIPSDDIAALLNGNDIEKLEAEFSPDGKQIEEALPLNELENYIIY